MPVPNRSQPSGAEKRQTLLYLLKKHSLKNFVETGTYRGDTVKVLADHVGSVNTIELDEKLFLAAKQQFAHQSHVKCWHGCSGKLLDEVLKQCIGPALIWLDGHYSGGVTARGEEVSPILKEILHVADSDNSAKHVILIDDVRLFDGKNYPHLSDTVDWIARHLPLHHIEVYNDIIFVEPPCDVSKMSGDALALGYQHAPRKIISTNGAYRLFFGKNFDREAAWRAGFHDSDCVSSIYIDRACRFGNSIQQWKHALGVALQHGLRRIYTPGYWWMKQGVFQLSCGIEVVNIANTIMSDEEVLLSGRFFDISGLRTFSPEKLTHKQAVQLLEENVVAKPAGDALPENHLVIHVRAGDIFTGTDIHPLYGQPPLAFYLNVLDSQNWAHVTLVAENGANPVWQLLIAHCQAQLTCDAREGMSLSEDIGFLLRAHTIVTARGTFASGLACLSPHWRKIITFENRFPNWGNANISSEIWTDVGGDYREKILASNWANTPAQREMMLSYPGHKLKKSTECI